ncbi:MAG TPA: hypothetical protein VFS87_05185 [Qipengyuania sp.]|nr:hypothetical protein [Qipengyuania sp.]
MTTSPSKFGIFVGLGAGLIGCEQPVVEHPPTPTVEIAGKSYRVDELLDVWHRNPNRSELTFQDMKVMAIPLEVQRFSEADMIRGFSLPIKVGGLVYPDQLRMDTMNASPLELELKYGDDAAAILAAKVDARAGADGDQRELDFSGSMTFSNFTMQDAAKLEPGKLVTAQCGYVHLTPVSIEFSDCALPDVVASSPA